MHIAHTDNYLMLYVSVCVYVCIKFQFRVKVENLRTKSSKLLNSFCVVFVAESDKLESERTTD